MPPQPRRAPSGRSRRSSRCASPCSAASRSCCSRSSSSASGSCRCCRARTTSPRRARTACARSGSRRRAATSSTATATVLVHDARRAGRADRPERAAGGRARRGRRRYRKARGAAEQARLAAADQLRALERRRREEERALHEGRAPRAPPPGPRRAPAPRRSRCRRCPPSELKLRALVPPPRARDRALAADDPRARDRGHRRGAVLERDDQDRRRRARSSTTCASARSEFPGVDVEKLFLRDYPHKELAAQLFGTRARDLAERSSRRRSTAASRPGTRIGAERPRAELRQYLRGQDGYTRVVINALGNRDDQRQVIAPRAASRASGCG